MSFALQTLTALEEAWTSKIFCLLSVQPCKVKGAGCQCQSALGHRERLSRYCVSKCRAGQHDWIVVVIVAVANAVGVVAVGCCSGCCWWLLLLSSFLRPELSSLGTFFFLRLSSSNQNVSRSSYYAVSMSLFFFAFQAVFLAKDATKSALTSIYQL